VEDQPLHVEALPEEPLTAPLPAIPVAAPVFPVAEPGVLPPAPFATPQSPLSPPPVPVPPAYYPPTYPPPLYPAPPAYPSPPYGAPGYSQGAIDYRNLSGMGVRGRPAIVTALGVVSIIVAMFSVIGSLFSGCTGLMTMSNARRAAVSMRAPSPTTMKSVTVNATPATPGIGNEPAGPDGLSPANRRVVIGAMKNRLRVYLTPQREQQIDAFLARHGKAVLSDPSDALTNRKVFDHLAEVGQEYSTPGTTPPAYFVFRGGTICKLPGRLRVMDDRWVYEPSDGSPTLRSPPPGQGETATATGMDTSAPVSPPLPDGLEESEARAILNRVRTLSNGRLNTAQAQALTNLLQSPTAGAYLTPSGTIPGYTAQVRSAAVRSDGTVQITFNMGQLTFDARGNTVGPVASPPAAGSTTSGGAAVGPNFVFTAVPVNRGSCTVVMLDAGLGVLLAVYLLVIAILALRQSPGTRRLFVIYGVVKIVCGVAAIVAFASIISSFNAAAATANPNMVPIALPWFTGISTSALVMTVIGLVFPVAVLLVLGLSRTAREYYQATG
jgi:hypothetical protein